jgi:FKBP-type peptidyl-prolyl cis-trans isomerase FkpA
MVVMILGGVNWAGIALKHACSATTLQAAVFQKCAAQAATIDFSITLPAMRCPVNFKSVSVLAFSALALSSTLALAQSAAPAAAAPDATAAASAKEAGAVVTPSGLVFRSLKDGKGASPTAVDKVKVHYRGTFPDGKEFDSSYKRNEAIEFPLSGVIKCWTEGVQRMKVGGKAKLTCPASIAYGERGAGGVIPPNATLLFEVELLAINGKS